MPDHALPGGRLAAYGATRGSTTGWEQVIRIGDPPSRRTLGLCLGFVLCIALPSIGQVAKYASPSVAVVYLVTCFAFFVVARVYVAPRVLPKISDRQVAMLAVAALAAAVGVFTVVYPIADDPTSFRGGSDADDALNLIVHELMQGRYPYYARTYLGNPVTPMPGAMFLAAPFVIIGNSAWQNFFWLCILFVVLKSCFSSGRSALAMMLLVLASSPIVPYAIVTGNDLLANSIYVLVATLLVMKTADSPVTARPLTGMAASVFLGVALSSRFNYFYVLPAVFSALARTRGLKTAIGRTTIALAALAAITMPFYWFDREGFSPLHTIGILSCMESAWSLAPPFVVAATGGIALVMAVFLRVDDRCVTPLGNIAMVQAFPVCCFVALAYLGGVSEPLRWMDYGISFLFFGAVFFWMILEDDPETRIARDRPDALSCASLTAASRS